MTMNNLGIANKVRLHLIYSNQWKNITSIELQNSNNTITYILHGENPNNVKEYVLAINKTHKVTVEDMDKLFKKIESNQGIELEKILMGIIDTDGSILFYYVHKGVKNFSD